MRHRAPRRTKWWGDSLIRCQGCGGLVTDATRYISRGDTFILCTPCFERVLKQENHPRMTGEEAYQTSTGAYSEGDDALSREASHYTP